MDEKRKNMSAATWMTFGEVDEPEEKSAKWKSGRLVGTQSPKTIVAESGKITVSVKDSDLVDTVTESGQEENYHRNNDKTFTKTVLAIRKKFIARRLIGNIYIYRIFFFATTAMRCKISASYYEEQDALPPDEREFFADTVGGYRRAISMTDILLDSLERRAMDWDGVDFNNCVMLTRGANFALAGPLVGFLGYTLTMDLSATVQSLIESRRRFEIQRSLVVPRSVVARWHWNLSKSCFSKTNPQIEKIINPDLAASTDSSDNKENTRHDEFPNFNTSSEKIKRYHDYDPRKEKNLIRELSAMNEL